MFPKMANPAWPHKIIKIFNEEVSKTAFGCGSCCNAELTSETRNDKTYFIVSLCRAEIPIENGEAKDYCTAFQKPITAHRSNGLPGLNPVVRPPAALHRP